MLLEFTFLWFMIIQSKVACVSWGKVTLIIFAWVTFKIALHECIEIAYDHVLL